MDAAELVKELRSRHGLTQAALAYRASTTQQAVSRIEQGLVSPTVEMLARLTAACGDELVLDARRREIPFDDDQLAGQASRSMEDRLELALGWNQFASEIAGKALAALSDG